MITKQEKTLSSRDRESQNVKKKTETKTEVADHLEMFIRDMFYEPTNQLLSC